MSLTARAKAAQSQPKFSNYALRIPKDFLMQNIELLKNKWKIRQAEEISQK
jgi:hypothetical protein